MSEYAVKEKAKRKSPAERSGQASPDYAGLSSVAAGIGNQAMLAMLGLQRGGVRAPQGQSLIDEFRQKFGLADRMRDAQDAAPPQSGGEPLAHAMRQKFERQFDLPMDDVRVHRGSDEPAKFDAGAYAYGSDIFIGPEQEELLEHEMTHVAQQKMGQVRPTGTEHGLAVNRSPTLEHSADTGAVARTVGTAAEPVVQCCSEVDEERNWEEEFAEIIRTTEWNHADAPEELHGVCHDFTRYMLTKLSKMNNNKLLRSLVRTIKNQNYKEHKESYNALIEDNYAVVVNEHNFRQLPVGTLLLFRTADTDALQHSAIVSTGNVWADANGGGRISNKATRANMKSDVLLNSIPEQNRWRNNELIASNGAKYKVYAISFPNLDDGDSDTSHSCCTVQ